MAWRILSYFLPSVFLCSLQQANAAQVTSFYPTGSVKQVQQVTVRFSSDMVAMGDPRSAVDPFTIKCNVSTKQESAQEKKPTPQTETPKYTTRWADSKSWVLDFAQPLPSGVRCAFTINAKARDQSGAKVTGLNEYSFSTSGPALLGVSPHYGEIEPEQYFVTLIDGALDPKSVESIAYFEVEGMPDKAGVKIIEGKEREDVIRAAVKSNWSWNNYKELLEQKPVRPLSDIKEMDNFLVLTSKRRFPENSTVVFHWPKGILAKTGLAVEEEQSFEFNVISPFLANFSCERTQAEKPCNPILDMRVNFTKHIALKSLRGAKIVAQKGQTWTPSEFNQKDSNKKTKENKEDEFVEALTFKAPFPEASSFKVILPENLKDELGRKLDNQKKYPLEVRTDAYSPLVKFPATFGILEWKADPILPVSVRNIETPMTLKQLAIEGKTINATKALNIIKLYRAVSEKEYDYDKRDKPLLNPNQGSALTMPKPLGKREFELVGVPLKNPGFYVVEMESNTLGNALVGKGKKMYVATSALVTDMAVHFKKGRESSLVWVTHLSNAKPVKNAAVTIFNEYGTKVTKGVTNDDGIFSIAATNYCVNNKKENQGDSCEVFAFAQKDNDMSFASSSWSKGIESYRFNLPTEYLPREWGPIVMHTILDRMAAQPGDMVHMKHVLREHRSNGFALMNEARLPKRAFIVHQESNKVYPLPLTLDKTTGTATSSFTIPKDATLGQYAIYLSNKNVPPNKEKNSGFDWSAKETGHIIVSEYRLPLMKATVKVQGEPLIQSSAVKTDLSASYLSGGPAKGLKVKLRASVQPGFFVPDVPGGVDYQFFSNPVQTGIVDSENHGNPEEAFLKVQDLTLDANGGLLAEVRGLPKVTKSQELVLEMEYTDPNGEIKTAATQVPLFPAEYAIGLRTDSWYNTANQTKVSGIITDNLGKPKNDRPFIVEAYQTNYITHRKRLVGGFYSYDSKSEVISLGKVCEGKSDSQGHFTCEPKGLPAGSITLQARTTDDKNRFAYAAVDMSIYETGTDTWWVPTDSDRIDLLPEKIRFEPGEKAKLIVRSPYPTATALVTVEREGVLDSFVTELKRDNPAIEITIKNHYAPNVFVSVLVVRGRVGDPKPTALLDLARPAMKMGMAELKVDWKAHELSVSVKSDKKKYHTRDKAEISIHVETATGAKLPPHSEVTIAAVDEGLLRLKENTSWQILKAMMGQRSLAVSTSSGQNQVVGRRHFGAKAKAAGGGGGLLKAANTRELFEPMLLWHDRLVLDSSGNGKISVPLNDSITSFRIVAIATAGVDLFGSGSTTIEASKDLIVYSGFAPLVREGDQIQNTITLRNTTTNTMKVALEVTLQNVSSIPTLSTVELKPSEAKTIPIAIKIPLGLKNISFQIKAKDSLSKSEDVLQTKVRVEPAVPERVLQSTLFQLEKNHQIPVQQPKHALVNQGGLNVSARATLASGLGGVKSYMEDYPYTCLEQKISRGIVLDNKEELKSVINAMPSYLDSSGLLKFFPSSQCGSVQLNRYVMDILDANGYEIPESTRTQLIAGLTSYMEGQHSCRSWWDDVAGDRYQNEAKILVLETLSRYKAFDPKFLSTIEITPNLWKNETAAAWFQLLKRQSEIPNRDAQLTQAENILRSRINFQGSLMNLQGDLDWEGQWHLFSSRDQEALGVFAAALDEPTWGEDMGRMARGVIARLQRGHWDTTMANAWGMTQLRRFSEAFEKEKISGETNVKSNEVSAEFNWQTMPNGERKRISWPKDSEKKAVRVEFTHLGTGKPWIHFETLAAIPLKTPWDMGYTISRKVTPITQSKPGTWQAGDVANIELTITAKSDQTWVVVRDPIPAGASHLGTGLDGSSNLLNRDPKNNVTTGDVQSWPTEYEEKSQANFVTYAAYLPRGTYRVNHRIRLNSAGEFKLPPARVEAMYSPETFGEVPNVNWLVTP